MKEPHPGEGEALIELLHRDDARYAYASVMGIKEAIAKFRMQQKLKLGQCRNCFKPLRDDQRGPFCSPACHENWLDKNF